MQSQRRSQEEALCIQNAQKQAQATELFGQNKEQEEKKEEESDSDEDDGQKLEFQLVWHPGENNKKGINFFQTYFYNNFIYDFYLYKF